MIERLHYLALPKVEESPRSVLLRTVTHNGYPSITHLTTQFRIHGVPPLSLQTGAAPLVMELAKEAGEHKNRFERVFYVQAKGVTRASPVTVMGTTVPIDMILWTSHKVCPQCLEENYLRSIQDFECVDVCPYHEMRYVSQCPGCESPFNWTKMQLSKCKCGHDLDPYQLTRERGDSHGAKTLLKFLRNGDELKIKRLQRVLATLKFDRCNDPTGRIYLFNQAVTICDHPYEGVMGRFVNMQAGHPGLPPRVLLAPFLAIMDMELREQAKAILSLSSPDFPAQCQECQCQDNFFTEPEVRAALGLSSKIINELSNSGYLEKMTVGKRGVEFPYQSVCAFYRNFKVSTKISEYSELLCPPNTFGASIGPKIDQIRKNKLLLVEADARKPITQFLISPTEVSKVEHFMAPNGYVSVQEAADRFNVYVDAVRLALKVGQISTRTIRGKSNTVYIPEGDVADFEKDFIFLRPLALEYEAKLTIFSAQLETAGILPVSGPRIDGGKVTIYTRSDLVGRDLAKIASMTDFQTRSGRNKGDPELYDKDKWLRAVEVGKLLKISVQLLSTMKAYGLLEEGTPPGREADNTRYFSVESAHAAKQWLDGSKKASELAYAEGSTPSKLDIRFIQSGYVKPLYIGVWTLISAEDVKRIRKHRKLYCTCSEAAAYIGAQPRHFHNMIKLGKISPVPAEESGIDSIILLRWSEIKK